MLSITYRRRDGSLHTREMEHEATVRDLWLAIAADPDEWPDRVGHPMTLCIVRDNDPDLLQEPNMSLLEPHTTYRVHHVSMEGGEAATAEQEEAFLRMTRNYQALVDEDRPNQAPPDRL